MQSAKTPFSYVDSALVFAYFNINLEATHDEQEEIDRLVGLHTKDRQASMEGLTSLSLGILNGHARHLYRHEWHHCLQNLFYPFLYLQSWRELSLGFRLLRFIRKSEQDFRLERRPGPY